jgi:hypothetical protein
MNTIEKVIDKLKTYPELKYKVDDIAISIEPLDENGFTIWLSIENKDEVIVGFDGDHQHFDSEEEAIECVLWGLSKSCRFRVTSRGKVDYKWSMQNKENDKWVTINTSYVIWLIPFWKKKKVRYLQNKVITEKMEAPSFIPK